MTTTQFKEKYPQYSHLEGDDLWDKMAEYVCAEGEQYIADPDREIVFHEPIIYNGIKVWMEDSSKTVWVNSKGEKGLIKEDAPPPDSQTTSYSMVIWDAGENKFKEL